MATREHNVKHVITAENRSKRAFDEVKRQFDETARSASAFSGKLAALSAIGISVAGVSVFIKSNIDAIASLDDFSERTGIAVERASELQQVLHISGTAMQEVEGFVIKLNKALAGADDDESKGAALALKQIGLNAEELRQKDPSQVLRDIALALDKFSDVGGGKSAVLGNIAKGGAQLLPFFKDLASEVGISARVTAEQASAAEELQKTFLRLSNVSKGLSTEITNGLVPSITKIGRAMLDARTSGDGFWGSLIEGARTAFQEMYQLNAGGDLRRVSEQIIKQTERIQRLETTRKGTDPAIADQRIAKEREELKLLTDRRDKLEKIIELETKGFNLAAQEPKPKLDVKLTPPGRPKKEDGRFDSAVRQLELEAQKAEDLTRRIEILRQIESGHFGTLIPQQKAVLEQKAKIVDAVREEAAARKADVEALKAMRAEAEKYNKEQEALADKWRDISDPTREHNRLLAEGVKLLQEQRITIEQFNAGSNTRLTNLLTPAKTDIDVLNEALKEGDISLDKYLEVVKRINGEVATQKSLVDELGLTFTSAFEDAIGGGKSLRDVLKGLESDLLRIGTRKLVTEPLGNFFTDLLKGAAGGSAGGGAGGGSGLFGGIASFIGGLFKAEGGPVSGGRPYIVGEQGPELFVPGASGSIVPNGQFALGGGGSMSVNIVQHFAGAVDRRTSMQAAADAGQQVRRALARNT